jgi:tetratricopeptide (TPR) repeat protein
VAWNLFHLGGLAIGQNQPKSALSFLTQSLELYSDMGDPWGIARVSQLMGTLYLRQGDYKKAYLYFDQHLKNDEKNSFMDGVSVALFNFGELYRLTGDNEQAAKYYEKSLAMCLEYGYKSISMPFTSLKPVEKPGE